MPFQGVCCCSLQGGKSPFLCLFPWQEGREKLSQSIQQYSPAQLSEAEKGHKLLRTFPCYVDEWVGGTNMYPKYNSLHSPCLMGRAQSALDYSKGNHSAGIFSTLKYVLLLLFGHSELPAAGGLSSLSPQLCGAGFQPPAAYAHCQGTLVVAGPGPVHRSYYH